MASSPDKTVVAATEPVAVTEAEEVSVPRFEYVGTDALPRDFITERRITRKDLKAVNRKASKDYVWSAATGWRSEVSDPEVVELLSQTDSGFKKIED